MDRYTPRAQKMWGGIVKSISWLWNNPAVVWPFLFAAYTYAMWGARVGDATKMSFIFVSVIVFGRFVILWDKNDKELIETRKLTSRSVHTLLSGINVKVLSKNEIAVTANGSTQPYVWPDGVGIIKDLCPDYPIESSEKEKPSGEDDENGKTPLS